MKLNNNKTKTGIIIITYNRPWSLIEAWMSCKDQGEVIIVANHQDEENSETKTIYQKLLAQGVNLVYFSKLKKEFVTKQALQSAKRNYGADILKQNKNIKYLTNCDDDNIFWPLRVERFETMDFDIAYCDLLVVSTDRNGERRFITNQYTGNTPPAIDTSSFHVSIDVFNKYRFDETAPRSEDKLYCEKLLSAGIKFKHLQFTGGEYRLRDYEERLTKLTLD